MGHFYPKDDFIDVPKHISDQIEFGQNAQNCFDSHLIGIDKALDKLFDKGKAYIIQKDHYSILSHSIDQKKINQAYLNALVTLDYFYAKIKPGSIENQILKVEGFHDYLIKRADKMDFKAFKIKLDWYYILNSNIDEEKVNETIKRPIVQFLNSQKMLIKPEVEEVKFNFMNTANRLFDHNFKQISLLKNALDSNNIAMVNILNKKIHASDIMPYIVLSVKENNYYYDLELLHPLKKNQLKLWKILKQKDHYLNLTHEKLLKLNGITFIDYEPKIPPLKSFHKVLRKLGFHHLAWVVDRSFKNLKYKFLSIKKQK